MCNINHLLFIAWALSLQTSAAAYEQAETVDMRIDLTREVKPISRYIYGVNQKLDGPFAHCTLTRSGGNRMSAYNWTNNASNAGSDWQFQNDNLLGSDDTPGGAVIGAIENARDHQAGIVLTVPMIGYVAADKNGGGDVRNSGADYLKTRFRESLPKKGAAFTIKPDPKSTRVFQDEFVNWVKTKYPYGQTDGQKPIFFSLDNEPDLWASTHKAVHPDPLTYAEIVKRTIDYASAIKDVSPKSLVFGPVSYGWQGYVDLQKAPDANGRDFHEFYLDELAKAEKSHKRRLLDVFDVHWYPEAQGGGVRIVTPDSKPEIAAARMQAPRSLWDSTYMEKSWITQWSTKGPIDLLHRLKTKIDKHYPSTKLAITEYNYGGGGDISGAIAQADVLGIFGREGLFAACEWPMAKDESFIAAAFEMFTNFDGKGASFGDTSVFADTGDVAQTSIHASIDSRHKGHIIFVAINKSANPVKATIRLRHCAPMKVIEAFELTADKSGKPRRTNASLTKDSASTELTRTLPAYSVSTIVLSE